MTRDERSPNPQLQPGMLCFTSNTNWCRWLQSLVSFWWLCAHSNDCKASAICMSAVVAITLLKQQKFIKFIKLVFIDGWSSKTLSFKIILWKKVKCLRVMLKCCYFCLFWLCWLSSTQNREKAEKLQQKLVSSACPRYVKKTVWIAELQMKCSLCKFS